MAGNRSARHTRNLEATKDIFYDLTSADAGSNIGAFGGGLVDDDDYDAWIDCYLPWDFDDLVEAKVVMIPQATLTPMTLRIITNYAQAGVGYTDGGETLDKSINTVGNRITELDIADCLDTKQLAPRDYIGVRVGRIGGQNTNAIVLGVRLRYNTPITSHAP
jgi:hypothetical protein